jgi:hypothetical protein
LNFYALFVPSASRRNKFHVFFLSALLISLKEYFAAGRLQRKALVGVCLRFGAHGSQSTGVKVAAHVRIGLLFLRISVVLDYRLLGRLGLLHCVAVLRLEEVSGSWRDGAELEDQCGKLSLIFDPNFWASRSGPHIPLCFALNVCLLLTTLHSSTYITEALRAA